MTGIDRYIERMTVGLPIDMIEDMREEIAQHVEEHIRELMIKGYSEKKATQMAITTFGNERSINWQMKKAVYPIHKITRFLWNNFFVTFVFCLLSFFIMEHYYPRAHNQIPVSSILGCLVIVMFISGMAEMVFEAIKSATIKVKYITNPWVFFLTPSIFVGCMMVLSYFQKPDQYQNGLWIDLLVIPIGAVIYVSFRQLFNQLFKGSI